MTNGYEIKHVYLATTRHRILVERSGRRACVRGLAHTHNRTEKKRKKRGENVRKRPIFTNLKKQHSST